MKNLKKRMSVCLLILISLSVFAQSEKSMQMLQKAKDAENAQQYIRALAYYFDAVEFDPENSAEAAAGAKAIADAIESGKPGLGIYDPFQMLDGWKALLLDAEKYFTEVMPFIVTFPDVWRQVSLDYNTKTANYKTQVTIFWSEKWYYIMELLQTGYEKAVQDNWVEFGMPHGIDFNLANRGNSFWPYVSVSQVPGKKLDSETGCYNVITNQKSYWVDGVAIITMPNGKYHYAYPEWKSRYSIASFYNAFATGCYDLSIKVTDEAGNVLVAPKRYFVAVKDSFQQISNNPPSDSGDYARTWGDGFALNCYPRGENSLWVEANNIPADKMELFENGTVKPVLEKVYLQYGYISIDDWEKEGTGFKKNLPEYCLDLTKTKELDNEYRKPTNTNFRGEK